MEVKDWIQLTLSAGSLGIIVTLLISIIRLTNKRISDFRNDVRKDSISLSHQLERTETRMNENVKSTDEKLSGAIRQLDLRLGDMNDRIQTLNQNHLQHLDSHNDRRG